MGGSFHFGWMLSVSICAALLSQPFTNSFSSDYNALGLNKESLEAGNNVFFVYVYPSTSHQSLLINLGSCLLVYIHVYTCIYIQHIYIMYHRPDSNRFSGNSPKTIMQSTESAAPGLSGFLEKPV